MPIRDPVTTDLPYRSELSFDETTMLIEWAVSQKYRGRVRCRGTDPEYPGSTYWELDAGVKVTLWPEEQRTWATHSRTPDADAVRIVKFLKDVLATHPPTRH